MPNYYFDKSAFIKLYNEEVGTRKVLDMLASSDGGLTIILDIALVKARSAIRRSQREGDLSQRYADRLLRRIKEEVNSSFLVWRSSIAVLDLAARLIDRNPLRANDAIQLAGCVLASRLLGEFLVFVCADLRLCDAANREGLPTENPLFT